MLKRNYFCFLTKTLFIDYAFEAWMIISRTKTRIQTVRQEEVDLSTSVINRNRKLFNCVSSKLDFVMTGRKDGGRFLDILAQ